MNLRKIVPKEGQRLLDHNNKVIPPEGTMVPNSSQFRLLVREGSATWADAPAAPAKPTTSKDK